MRLIACVACMVMVWSGGLVSGGRRGGGSSDNSSNEWWWCGGGYSVVNDISKYNINNYIRWCWVWGCVGLWIRTNFTRFTLKVLHFCNRSVKNELKPYNLQGF